MNRDLVTTREIAERVTKPDGTHYSRQRIWQLTNDRGFPKPVPHAPLPAGVRLFDWAEVQAWFAQRGFSRGGPRKKPR